MRAVQENPTSERLGLQTALSSCFQQDKKVELQEGGLNSLPVMAITALLTASNRTNYYSYLLEPSPGQ